MTFLPAIIVPLRRAWEEFAAWSWVILRFGGDSVSLFWAGQRNAGARCQHCWQPAKAISVMAPLGGRIVFGAVPVRCSATVSRHW